jgi:hypothetical protein
MLEAFLPAWVRISETGAVFVAIGFGVFYKGDNPLANVQYGGSAALSCCSTASTPGCTLSHRIASSNYVAPSRKLPGGKPGTRRRVAVFLGQYRQQWADFGWSHIRVFHWWYVLVRYGEP